MTITDFDPQVSGNHVVWWGGSFGNRHVYLNDGSSVTKAISETGTQNQIPQIDGNLVVWQGNDGDDRDRSLGRHHASCKSLDNDYTDTNPRISGNHIVWQVGSSLASQRH